MPSVDATGPWQCVLRHRRFKGAVAAKYALPSTRQAPAPTESGKPATNRNRLQANGLRVTAGASVSVRKDGSNEYCYEHQAEDEKTAKDQEKDSCVAHTGRCPGAAGAPGTIPLPTHHFEVLL